MPLVPRASLTYLDYFFFPLFSPHILWLTSAWERNGEFLSALPVTQHHPARSDIYFKWLKSTCHHQLDVSV